MMKTVFLLKCLLPLILICGSLSGQYYIYDLDGSYLSLNIFDSLVTVHLDTLAGIGAEGFAYERPYLQDDFDFVYLGDQFIVYGIESGFGLDEVMDELLYDTAVLMVNPVLGSGSSPYYMNDRLIVKANEGYTAQQIHDILDSNDVFIYDSIWEEDLIYFGEYSSDIFPSLIMLCNYLYEQGAFQYVVPNCIYTSDFLAGMSPEPKIPQDPYFAEQWHLHNTEQSGGIEDADIDMPEAWDMKPENSSTLIAILDFGYDMEHEDLKDYWEYWPYDVVGGTYLDDIHWLPDSYPYPPFTTDLKIYSHGTMMLGLISATIDNTTGLAGTEDYARVMPIKICDIYGNFNDQSFIKALRYASTRPWPVDIYCSGIHFDQYFPHLELELKRLYERGKPFFTATANEGSIKYPASSPYTFAVGATDKYDLVPSWSGQGSALDICAPGDEIWSFDFSGPEGYNDGSLCNGDPNYYCGYSGTCPAAAITAGIAAKLLATRSNLISKSDNAEPVYELLRYTANDLYPPGHDNISGFGRLNAYRAMIAISHGDANHDFVINVSDAIYIINYVFQGGDEPIPHLSIGDANCDGAVNVSDAVWIINYVFIGGPPPPVCYLNLPE
ncbi:MAG: S8 family serine peptidase [candidate division Zixibacteria bacterium]|nr:S8 family serine peptidase [candidate division Zixibacteria bacterium]